VHPQFALLEFDFRRLDKIQPGEKGMEGFYSDDKEPSLRSSICFYFTFWRMLFCVEYTYSVIRNKFAIRKELRKLLDNIDE
jgi:hypothetical protein